MFVSQYIISQLRHKKNKRLGVRNLWISHLFFSPQFSLRNLGLLRVPKLALTLSVPDAFGLLYTIQMADWSGGFKTQKIRQYRRQIYDSIYY